MSSSPALVCKVEPVFIARGCNVEGGCMDWSAVNGMVAFGAGRAVGVFSPTLNAVLATYAAPDVVTKVRWLPGTNILFASCSTGLLVIPFEGQHVFASLSTAQKASFTIVPIADPERGVRFHGLCVLRNGFGAGHALIAVVGTHMAVLRYSEATGVCESVGDVIALQGSRLSECVAATFLPHSHLVLVAVGAADKRIHLFVNDARCASDPGGLGYVAWLEGHQDWVRDLDWCVEESTGDVILASCSHDNYIRLWRVTRFTDAMVLHKEGSTLEETERQQRVLFSASDAKGNVPRFAVGLEALLIGHRHWVQSVRWRGDGQALVSASMDKTMIVWARDPEDGVWLDRYRVGEIGGNALGFYGAVFAPDASAVLGHSFNGSFHFWRRTVDPLTGAESYHPVATISGHMGEVTDVSWDHEGRYLISSSVDETVRLWTTTSSDHRWNELARPQIHGHPLSSAIMVPGAEHLFVTGAEEKSVRVFTATSAFVHSLRNVAGLDTHDAEGVCRPFGAAVPPLGLSNKPLLTAGDAAVVEEARQEEAFGDELPRAAPEILNAPPVETQLSQSTLWPELKKLYGHGAEIFALAASHDGSLIASACKGKAKPHTDVLLWRVSDWTTVGRLSSHKMTVTRIAFSHSDQFIATVSRDLKLCLWKRDNANDGRFVLSFSKEKAHSRIIWDCCWSPDDEILVTCSRDRKVTFWELDTAAGELTEITSMKRSSVPTSCAFHPKILANGGYALAVGTEEGSLSLWTNTDGSRDKWRSLVEVQSHGLAVKRLSFQFQRESQSMLLASAGADGCVRVHRITLTTKARQLASLALCVQASLGVELPYLILRVVWKHLRSSN